MAYRPKPEIKEICGDFDCRAVAVLTKYWITPGVHMRLCKSCVQKRNLLGIKNNHPVFLHKLI